MCQIKWGSPVCHQKTLFYFKVCENRSKVFCCLQCHVGLAGLWWSRGAQDCESSSLGYGPTWFSWRCYISKGIGCEFQGTCFCLLLIIINVKVFSFNCFLCLKLLTKLLLKETSNTTEDWTINKVVPFFRELVRPFSIYHTSE